MKIKSEIIGKFRHDIGAELRQQREAHGWTVEQAAEKFNLGHPLFWKELKEERRIGFI